MVTATKKSGDTPEEKPPGKDEENSRLYFENEDGSIQDMAAKDALKREQDRVSTAPQDQKPADHSYGTPAGIEARAPEGWVSDGGPTVAPPPVDAKGNEISGDQSVLDVLSDPDEDDKDKKDTKSESKSGESK